VDLAERNASCMSTQCVRWRWLVYHVVAAVPTESDSGYGGGIGSINGVSVWTTVESKCAQSQVTSGCAWMAPCVLGSRCTGVCLKALAVFA
jgi:hypothetical protein